MTRTSYDVIHVTLYHTSSTCATNVTLNQCTGCSRARLVSNVSEDRRHSIIIAQNCWMLRIRGRTWISIVTARGMCQRESPWRIPEFIRCGGTLNRDIELDYRNGFVQRYLPVWINSVSCTSINKVQWGDHLACVRCTSLRPSSGHQCPATRPCGYRLLTAVLQTWQLSVTSDRRAADLTAVRHFRPQCCRLDSCPSLLTAVLQTWQLSVTSGRSAADLTAVRHFWPQCCRLDSCPSLLTAVPQTWQLSVTSDCSAADLTAVSHFRPQSKAPSVGLEEGRQTARLAWCDRSAAVLTVPHFWAQLYPPAECTCSGKKKEKKNSITSLWTNSMNGSAVIIDRKSKKFVM